RAWAAFQTEADMTRPKGSNQRKRWSYRDALAKARAICRKAPKLMPPRRRGYHPARHLHAHHHLGYWTTDKKTRHQAEAAKRITAASVLAVNKAMLDAVALENGLCLVTVAEIAKSTGYSERTVKNARSDLLKLGLWITGDRNGAYAPFAFEKTRFARVSERPRKIAHRVQRRNHPLYRSSITVGIGNKRSSTRTWGAFRG